MKYLAWCNKKYIFTGKLLEAMIESIGYGTGDKTKEPNDKIIFENGQYVITEDENSFCYLFSK